MMAVVTTLLAAAWLGVGPGDDSSSLAAAAASSAVEKFAGDAPSPGGSAAIPPPNPVRIAFEVREIGMSGPDWRGKLLSRLEPVARREGATVWTVDRQGLLDLLKYCQADARCNVATAPPMIAEIGAPARLTNETTHKYVANLKRESDGPPNQGTRLAFIPEVDEVHDGIRVSVTSSRLEGPALRARVAVEENRLISFVSTRYSESVQSGGVEKADAAVAKTSLIDRLRPARDGSTTLGGVISVPETASSRIEGEWLIPREGALLISMGPIHRRDKGLRGGYEERLIALTARPTTEPATPQAPANNPAATP